MKFVFLIFIFWESVTIEGFPKNYEQRIESRSVGDLPVINWFYGNHPDQIKPGENDKELIKVVPLDEAGPTDEPEPIENFLDELKEKAKETDNKDGTTMHLLTDLNKTLSETSTKLAKVFVNGAWRIFDIGALGTSRRTRNLEEVSYLLAPFYAFIALLNQLLHGIQLGNNSQRGSIFDLFLPLTYLSNALYGPSPPIHPKLLHELSGSRGAGQKHNDPIHDSSVNYIFVIDNRNKENANRLLNGKSPSEVLSKVKYYLDKDDLDPQEKFYIVWKLSDLFSDLSENDDGTNLKLIRMITRVSEDPRFDELFEILKSKNDPEFQKIWKLFRKSHSKLNKNYLSIIKNLPEGKIIQHPSQHCFIIAPSHDSKIKRQKKKSGIESDEEKLNLHARNLESSNNYRICCIDDDNESKANRFLGDGSRDELLSKIKKHCDEDHLDPENQWYILLKLYNMIKNLDKDDKDESKIIPLISQIGKDPKFEEILENIKTKKDPRFEEISKLFKSDSKDLEEIIKSMKKKETEKKDDPKPDSPKDPPKDETTDDKSAKDEKEQKKLQDEKEQKKLQDEKEQKKLQDEKEQKKLQDEKEQKKLQDEKESKKDDVMIKTTDPPTAKNPETIEKPSSASSDLSKATISENHNLKPPKKRFWFHDPSQERNARMIRDKVHYYTTKDGVSYSDLEEVENLLKDPSLDKDLKQDLITFVNKWYGSFVRNEHVKHKFDELVHIIRVNPEYNNFFETLNPGREEPRDDKELKRLLKPPGETKSEPKAEKPLSMISRIVQERNNRLMKDKVRSLSSKTEVSYEDLENVENLLNDPSLDLDSKYDVITFVHKWYGTFVRNEKMKKKFDELVHLIKRNPDLNSIFETLNPARKENLNNTEIKEAPVNHPENHIGGLTGKNLDRFLTNAENYLRLRNPALDVENRKQLIKMIYSWHKYQNLDERIKTRIGDIIKNLDKNPDNHPYLEIKRE